MDPFEYNASAARVIFGSGTLQRLPDELHRQGLHQPLLLSTPQQASQLSTLESLLTTASSSADNSSSSSNGNGSKITKISKFTNATMHTPVEVTTTALAYARDQDVDCVVSIGGGSTIGLGKALSVRTGWPHICIPTTYAGSEMTPILGETENGKKTTRSDEKIRPGTVIYDVDLTLTLPPALSAASGVNAIAHAVEALYAKNRNPIISLFAQEGIKSLASALPEIIEDPSSQPARQRALYGAWLCATCLGNVGMALHHKLCHTLGGSFNLPHAETHTIVLPHALSYNAPAIPDVTATLASVLPGSDGDAVRGLNVLLDKLRVKRALKDYGMADEADVDKAAEMAVSNPYWNPRPVEKGPLREVIRRCWAGEAARGDL